MHTEPIVESSVTAETLGARYRGAYAAAKFLRALGSIIRWVAVILSILFLVGGFASLGESGSDEAFTAVLFAAILTGFCGFCMGVFVSALSHPIKASADTAINTSPLLSTETKERLLNSD
jgi:hypothetical protein